MEWAKLAARPRGWGRELAAAAAVGAFLGAVGPFGSYSSGTAGVRMAYWTAAALLGTLFFGTAVRIIAARRLPAARAVPLVAAVAALLSVPFAILVAVPAQAIWPYIAEIPGLHWYLQVLTVSAPLCAAWLLLKGQVDERASGQFPRQRQAALGVDPLTILCLEMEDHYVRVYHAGGSVLVLTTMRQAREVLQTVRGIQIHRSWWVAERAVAESLLEGRNLRLRLINGLVVPVSRSAVSTVRAAGWLSRGGPA